MIKSILEIFIVGCGLTTLVALIIVIREGLLISKLSNLTLSDLPVKKKIFCQLVLDWCHDNIAYSKTSKPILKVNYYAHKRWNGVYYSANHLCVIYVNNHDNIKAITNSVIHEYVHARQRNRNFDKLYEKYQRDFGYELNPLEQESRKVAKDREVECMMWVCTQLTMGE